MESHCKDHHTEVRFCEGCRETYLHWCGQREWHAEKCFGVQKGEYECEACGKGFWSVLDMQRHFGEEHAGARYCEGCRRTFWNRNGKEWGHGPDCFREGPQGGEETEEGEREREKREGREDEKRKEKGREKAEKKAKEHVWAQERFLRDGVEMRCCPNCREFFLPRGHCSCPEDRRPKKPREIQHCFRCRTAYYDDSHCACPRSSGSSSGRHQEKPAEAGQKGKSSTRQRVPPSFRKQHYPANEEKYRSKGEGSAKNKPESDYCWHCKTMYWDNSHRDCPRPGQSRSRQKERGPSEKEERSDTKKQQQQYPKSEERYQSKPEQGSARCGPEGKSNTRKQQDAKSESRYRSWRKENTKNGEDPKPKGQGPSQGIPPLYEYLKAHPLSSHEKIAEAARKRRIEVHPDRLKRPGMTAAELKKIDERAKDVGYAADVLLDPVKRSKYDREMAEKRKR